jgi:hypothetical protein
MMLRITAMITLIAIASNLLTGAFLNAGCGQIIAGLLIGFGLGGWGVSPFVLIQNAGHRVLRWAPGAFPLAAENVVTLTVGT